MRRIGSQADDDVIPLHRYFLSRPGSLQIASDDLVFTMPAFREPLRVPIAQVAGMRIAPRGAYPDFPVPHRRGRLIYSNLALSFSDPVPSPAIAPGMVLWPGTELLHGLSLRVADPVRAADLLEAAGIPYLTDR